MKKGSTAPTHHPTERRSTRGVRGRRPAGSDGGAAEESPGAKNPSHGRSGFSGENHGEYGEKRKDFEDSGFGKKQKIQQNYSKKDSGARTSKSIRVEKDMRFTIMESKRDLNAEGNLGDMGTLHGWTGKDVFKSAGRQFATGVGPSENQSSPSGYMGPLISEVEKSIKENCMGSNGLQPINLCNLDKSNGFPKVGEEHDCGTEQPFQEEGPRKKRQANGELKLGVKTGVTDLLNGSGMAEAAMQSRRPQ
jgi:hypothetical protein